jgi:hypothetical protein
LGSSGPGIYVHREGASLAVEAACSNALHKPIRISKQADACICVGSFDLPRRGTTGGQRQPTSRDTLVHTADETTIECSESAGWQIEGSSQPGGEQPANDGQGKASTGHLQRIVSSHRDRRGRWRRHQSGSQYEKRYGQGAEGYFKRWGAAMAFASSNQLIGAYAVASMLHEDPRYFVEDSGEFRESVRYAVSRVFICRKDDGSTTTNWAGILGPLGAAGLANAYLPADSQGVGHTFGKWGISLAFAAGTNVFREYWPHINKKLRLPPMDIDSGPGTMEPKKTATPTIPQ